MQPSELRGYRRTAGVSQVTLAKQLRVSSNTVSRWELGAVPIPAWVALVIELRATIAAKEKALAAATVGRRPDNAERFKKRLATQFHPDKNGGSFTSAEIMSTINSVYQSL